MQLQLVPLLQLQRDLYTLPRDQARFQTYLNTMLNADASDVEFLPMTLMNPMGKEHIPALLDDLLAMDAEAVATQSIAEVLNQNSDEISEQFKSAVPLKLGLVVADDLLGGWTNRYTSEFTIRFEVEQTLKRGWLTVVLWTSETISAQKVHEETLTTLYRAVYVQRYGVAQTLQDRIDQEGWAMAMAGCQEPTLDPEEMAYTQAVISPHLLTQDYPILMACLFGDRAAHLLGYPAQGLSERAGLALALHQAQNYPS